MRVLVVEDQAELADDIADGLRDQGIGADVAYDGPAGIEKALMNSYDVVILDRDLPKVHGDAVCATLAGSGSAARILMLTAAATVGDRVQGLNLGADDYLGKPFAFEELVARVRALARRAPAAAPVIVRGDIVFDRARRRVSRAGRPLSLTRKEMGILEELLVADGGVVSTEDLLERVWDENADPFTRTVTVTIRRLGPQKVRTRLTLLYAALFFAAGSALLGLTYGLVASSLPTQPSAAATVSSQELNNLNRECIGALKGKHPVAVPTSLPAAAACKEAEVAYNAGTAAGLQAQRQHALRNLLVVSLVGLGVMTVASGGLGWFMSGRVLRPVRVITQTARRASEQHLGERLALTGARDELKELADTFDDMLERLDAAFATQRRFVANASHELRTPLTLMRTD